MTFIMENTSFSCCVSTLGTVKIVDCVHWVSVLVEAFIFFKDGPENIICVNKGKVIKIIL